MIETTNKSTLAELIDKHKHKTRNEFNINADEYLIKQGTKEWTSEDVGGKTIASKWELEKLIKERENLRHNLEFTPDSNRKTFLQNEIAQTRETRISTIQKILSRYQEKYRHDYSHAAKSERKTEQERGD